MAIDTDTKKLALMEWGQPWEPGIPLSPGTLDTADQQHLIWEYSGIDFTSITIVHAKYGHRAIVRPNQ